MNKESLHKQDDATAKTIEHVRGLLTAEQAERFGRDVFAATLLNTGFVALTAIIDYKRAVGVFSVYGDANARLDLDKIVEYPAAYAAAALAK